MFFCEVFRAPRSSLFPRPQALKNGKSAGEALGGTTTPPRGALCFVTKPLETVKLLLLLQTTYAIVDNCIYMGITVKITVSVVVFFRL